jgi:hypothetical protein
MEVRTGLEGYSVGTRWELCSTVLRQSSGGTPGYSGGLARTPERARAVLLRVARLSGKRDALLRTRTSVLSHTWARTRLCTHALRTFVCVAVSPSWDGQVFLALLRTDTYFLRFISLGKSLCGCVCVSLPRRLRVPSVVRPRGRRRDVDTRGRQRAVGWPIFAHVCDRRRRHLRHRRQKKLRQQ